MGFQGAKISYFRDTFGLFSGYFAAQAGGEIAGGRRSEITPLVKFLRMLAKPEIPRTFTRFFIARFSHITRLYPNPAL